MPSRQDQLHSYQFMVSRVVAALVMRETDPAQSPFRRVAGAALAGTLLAALALGGVAAYGLISPGGSGKVKENVVIQEKHTGAKYLYADGVLHPMANYASALLAVDAAGAKTVVVSQNSLNGRRRGVAWGIANAPDSLPPAKRLSRGPWTVCSQSTADGVESVLFVGGRGIDGGEQVGGPDSLGGKALLVSTFDGAQYLIWGGYRHLVREPERVTAALLWGNRRFPLATAVVNALPAGPDVRFPDFGTALGKPAPQPPGARVGQVFRFQRSETARLEYYVSLAEGVAAMTPLEAALILNDPRSPGTARPAARDLTRAEFTALGDRIPPMTPRPPAGALPDNPPELVEQPPPSVCSSTTGVGTVGTVRYNVAVPETAGMPTTGASATGTALADEIVIEPGSGVLVESVSSAGAPSGQFSIVTDLGISYAVPDDRARAKLGYAGLQPVRMPAELVALLPLGPSLDPDMARAPLVR